VTVRWIQHGSAGAVICAGGPLFWRCCATPAIIDEERGPTDTEKLRELLSVATTNMRGLHVDYQRRFNLRLGTGLGLLQMDAAAAEQSQQTDND
jgi:hypothetical protein